MKLNTAHWMLFGLYAFAGALAIFVLWGVHMWHPALSLTALSYWQTAFIAAVVLTLLASFFIRVPARVLWEGMCMCAVFMGVWFLCMLLMPFGWAVGCAAGLTLAHLFFSNVLSHNFFYLIGCVGVAVNYAAWLSPDVLLVGLVLFAVYDTVIAPQTSAIEILAVHAFCIGIVPGIVVPSSIRGMVAPLRRVVQTHELLIGAGDIVVPLALVAKAGMQGIFQGGVVLSGLLFATGAASILLKGYPRAVLPILAAGTAFPFVVLRMASLI